MIVCTQPQLSSRKGNNGCWQGPLLILVEYIHVFALIVCDWFVRNCWQQSFVREDDRYHIYMYSFYLLVFLYAACF